MLWEAPSLMTILSNMSHPTPPPPPHRIITLLFSLIILNKRKIWFYYHLIKNLFDWQFFLQKGPRLILRKVTLKQCRSERAQRTLRHSSFVLFSCLLNRDLFAGFQTRWHSISLCAGLQSSYYSIMWYFSPFSTEKAPNTSLKSKTTDGNEQTKSVSGE